jgi:protein phosphatase 1 regulatory subunit 37
MCREILNTCVRNTEEAERATKANVEGASVSSGRGLGRGVWGMIEESELAKSIRLGEEKKVGSFSTKQRCDNNDHGLPVVQNETDIVVRAWAYVTQLDDIVASESGKPSNTGKKGSESFPELISKSKAVASELAVVIQETEDPSRLEELLGINDKLLSLLKKVPGSGKPNLKLQGLGLGFGGSQNSSEDGDGRLDGLPNINGRANEPESASSESNSVASDEDDEDLPTPTTPKIDKGKRRAEPEPEEPEMILSPNISRMNVSSEDETLSPEYVASPTDR